jgi:hypothetical protein
MTLDIGAQQQAARERFEREHQAQQRKLRSQGAAIGVVGLLLNAVNAFMVIANGSFFVLTLFMGPVMLFLGIWLAAFGRPVDVATGQLAKWGNAGLLGTIALGVVVGIVGFVLLKG